LFAPEPSPVTVPPSEFVTVTLSEDALNPVTVFPQASCAVSVFVPVNAVPFACGLASDQANFESDPADTATDRRSLPPALRIPSVTAIVGLSAL
jgi:hypothetical protein